MARDKRNRSSNNEGTAGGQGAEAGRRRAATAESATSEEQCHPRKIFVGGLAHKTTTQQLRDHFQRHGSVVDAVVLRWPDGRSRGFGYVTFAEAGPASAAIRGQPHYIGSRQVDVKRAVPGTNKLFVGGLPQQSSAAELRGHFENFGVVSDAVVMIDPATSRSRGFGFVCFLPGQEGAEAVSAALADYKNHRLRGKWIEVKSAAPPHKLAAGKDGPSEEERLLAEAASPTASPDASPQSAGGRPVATPHRQLFMFQQPTVDEPQKVPVGGLCMPHCCPPGIHDGFHMPVGHVAPPGLVPTNECEIPRMPSEGMSATSTETPTMWDDSRARMKGLGATSTSLGLWDDSNGPVKVHINSGSALGTDPWTDADLDVAAPLLGRFGASEGLQKSLEELLRLQSKEASVQEIDEALDSALASDP